MSECVPVPNTTTLPALDAAVDKDVYCLPQQNCSTLALAVTSQELKRWLQKQGCTFETGHSGHLVVRRGSKVTDLPMHGKQKELGTGLVHKIKKDLGLR